tara:strand:- start:532 stop:780 length:249 start_codon:yes stop_codon:yes gene_type:complete
MPQIGWFELLIIVIISILVIGPKDFPIVLKKIGSWIGSSKRYFSDVQKNINQITDVDYEKDEKKDNNKIESEKKENKENNDS